MSRQDEAAACTSCEVVDASQPGQRERGLTRPTAETALMMWTDVPRLSLTNASLAALYDVDAITTGGLEGLS